MNRIAGIKAISFDGDGTLWDFEKVMRRSLSHVLKELEKVDRTAASMLDVERMINIRDKVAGELKGGGHSLEDIRFEAFRQTLRDIDRPSNVLADHLNEIYLKHRFEDIELFDDVLPVLKVLRAKYTLGLLSNGNTYPDCCGLENILRFAVFSQDYGVEKPDPRLFLIAVGKAGCSNRELLHVGDSLHNDIVGAKNANVKCVWLNRKQVKGDLDIRVDYEVSSFSELPGIL